MSQSNNNNLETLFKQAWHETFEVKDNDLISTIQKYFAPNFIEEINNNSPLDYRQFIEHVQEVRNNSIVASINYIKFIETDNTITCLQEFIENLKGGTSKKTKVMMIATVQDNKFTHLHEVCSEPTFTFNISI
ncbi:hypothetical protein ACFX5K_01445 [Rickettsiales bacterium LUAb2]